MVETKNFKTDLDAYKRTNSEDFKPWFNVENARKDKLLGKWYTVKKAYLDEATDWDKNGNPAGKVDKMHLEFEEIEHLMTLNFTNLETMQKDFGTESDNWIGQKVKMRINKWPSGTEGIVIVDKQELEDMGETPPESSSKTRQSDEQAIDDILNQENEPKTLDLSGKEVNGISPEDDPKQDWFILLQKYLPETPEDIKNPEKRAAEWINRIRQDIISPNIRNPTIKMIRDNVNILVEDGHTFENDLGKLDIETGRGIFALLHKVEK